MQAMGRQLQACGYYEAITVDFVDAAQAALFRAEGTAVLCVNDATRKESNQLRQTLLGSLLGVLKTNVNAKTLPCRIYEISNTFVPSTDGGLPREHAQLGLVADGDFRRLRAAVECVVGAAVKDPQVAFIPVSLPWALAGAQVQVNGTVVGLAGVFTPAVVKQLEIKNLEPVGAELDLHVLTELAGGDPAIKPVARFPAIERDLSILVPEPVLWSAIQETIQEASPDELEEIRFVEIYRGKGIAPSQKSVTLSLRFRDADGTLKHEVVDTYQQRIVAALAQRLHAALRAV
jgi:phenylalanyl-tRNA synthetase beta chain